MIETIKGVTFYSILWEDKPSRLLESKSQCNTESLSIEINLRKRYWFLNCTYNPHRNSISRHNEYLNHIFDEYSKTYNNFVGDFNVGIDEKYMKNFCDTYYQKSLIKVPTCFQLWQTHILDRPYNCQLAQSIPTQKFF